MDCHFSKRTTDRPPAWILHGTGAIFLGQGMGLCHKGSKFNVQSRKGGVGTLNLEHELLNDFFLTRGQHDFTEVLASFEVALGGARFRQGESFVDHRLEFLFLHKF